MFTNLIHSFAGVRWARTTGLSAMTSQWSTPASLSQVWWRGVPTSSGCGPWTRPESAIHPVSLRLWSPWIPQTEPASEVRATSEPCGTLQQSQQLHFFNVFFPPPPTAGPSAPWTGMIKFTEEEPAGMTASDSVIYQQLIMTWPFILTGYWTSISFLYCPKYVYSHYQKLASRMILSLVF